MRGRLEAVLAAVESRIQEISPDADLDIDLSVLDQLKGLPYDGFLAELVKLFSQPVASKSTNKSVALSAAAVASLKASPAAGGSGAGGSSGGSTVQVPVGPGSITTNIPVLPHVRGWWHNMWGH
ncbi:MAG: hypothetical protein ACT4OM_13050 [Actinomycetota bacterium]